MQSQGNRVPEEAADEEEPCTPDDEDATPDVEDATADVEETPAWLVAADTAEEGPDVVLDTAPDVALDVPTDAPDEPPVLETAWLDTPAALDDDTNTPLLELLEDELLLPPGEGVHPARTATVANATPYPRMCLLPVHLPEDDDPCSARP